MQHAAPPSNELPGLSHWACASHPLRPASGGYGCFDPVPMFAAVTTAPIPAILILPRVDGTGRPADPADWYAGLTGLRNPQLINPG
jgi:hypothetical protein